MIAKHGIDAHVLRPSPFEERDRFLIVCPHPDDEVLGCGAFMLSHPGQCDVLCLSSSGFAEFGRTPEEDADIRIAEFHAVMAKALRNPDGTPGGHAAITRIFGKPPMYRQLREHIPDYLGALRDIRKYACVFLPHPRDGHREHRYITNRLFKRLLLRLGVVFGGPRIAFYEVWMQMGGPWTPNALLRMDKDLLARKIDLLQGYPSQLNGNPVPYADKISALNIYRGIHCFAAHAAEAFHVTTIPRYLTSGLFCHNNPYRGGFLDL